MRRLRAVRPGRESAASRNLHVITQVGELGLTYPWYIQKIFDRLEETMLLAVGNDALGDHRPDPGQGLELGRGRLVEVDFSVRRCSRGSWSIALGPRDHDLLAVGQRSRQVDRLRSGARQQPSGSRYCVGHPGTLG